MCIRDRSRKMHAAGDSFSLPARLSRLAVSRRGTWTHGSSIGFCCSSSFARKGGKARAKKLTVEERRASAKKAAEARWAKRR